MQKFLDQYLNPPRDGEGAGGGGGEGKTGEAAPAAPAPYHPAGLPDNFQGSDDRATIDALYGAYAPLREKLNGIPKAPENLTDYKVEFDEKTTAALGDLNEDPLMQFLPGAAKEFNLTADQYGFVGSVMNKMVELGAYAKQPSDSDLAESMVDPKLEGQAKIDGVTASMERLTNSRAWVDNLGDGFSEHEKAELTLMTTSSGGVSLIEKLMAGTLGNTVAPGGKTLATGGSIQDVITSRLSDPRNLPGSSKFDKPFALETRRMQQQHSG